MSSNEYTNLKTELDKLIAKLEDESLDVDEAIKLYEKSQKVIAEMDVYLKKSEAKIKKITRS
ncbi:exodeoxyribonuclease VII small subunit [Candidatus Parcubacteria bacterium]|nr:exodeoxyribonuclease VII small subunit [Candidatus Parcubacteria bacterium]